MVNRRIKPYLIAVCIVVVLCMSYIGIRAYKGHVELDELLSDARAVNRSDDARHLHSSDNHAHEHEGDSLTASPQHEHNHAEGHEGKSYEIDGVSVTHVVSTRPMSREELELNEWIVYGKLTPYVDQQLKRAESLRKQNEELVLQQVITPDGKLRTVFVHKDEQYEDGDVISSSEIIGPGHPWFSSENQIEEDNAEVKRSEEFKLIQDGVEYPMPEEYYALDGYERREFVKKFRLTLDLDISMEEVEAKVAAGELDVSLNDAEKKQIDALSAIHTAPLPEEETHRLDLLDTMTPKPTPSNKPPVKVTIKPVNAPPIPPQSQNDDKEFWESVLADVETASDERIDEPSPTPKAVPEIPISTPRTNWAPEVENSLPMEEVPPIPDNPTSESVKAQLKERLSPELFSKAQKLLEEYGAEEGLRKFRETSSEHKGEPRHSHENLDNSIR